MKTNGWIIAVVALLLATAANISYGQASDNLKGWTQLGSRVVDYRLDHDVVTLNGKESFTSLKIVVKNGTLKVHKATVHFANGDKQDISFHDVVPPESGGNTIDLKGNDRVIEKVTFWYNTKAKSKEKAIVEVYGRKS